MYGALHRDNETDHLFAGPADGRGHAGRARGGQLALLLTIRHSGDTADRYHVELRDIPRDWYTLDKPTVIVQPGAEERVQLVVYPPSETLAAPDTSAITIRVTSETDPAIHTSAVVALPLQGGGGWRMDLAPPATRGRTGAFRVTLLNQTPRPAAVSVVARDTEDALRIRVVLNDQHRARHRAPPSTGRCRRGGVAVRLGRTHARRRAGGRPRADRGAGAALRRILCDTRGSGCVAETALCMTTHTYYRRSLVSGPVFAGIAPPTLPVR